MKKEIKLAPVLEHKSDIRRIKRIPKEKQIGFFVRDAEDLSAAILKKVETFVLFTPPGVKYIFEAEDIRGCSHTGIAVIHTKELHAEVYWPTGEGFIIERGNGSLYQEVFDYYDDDDDQTQDVAA